MGYCERCERECDGLTCPVCGGALLQAVGIPVLTRYPEGGGLGKVYLGFSGYGVDLYVPKSRESEARALLLHDE